MPSRASTLHGLVLALPLVAEQTIKEAEGERAEFREAFAEQVLLLARVGAGPMRLLLRTLSGHDRGGRDGGERTPTIFGS